MSHREPMRRAYSAYSAADTSCSPSVIGNLETLDLRNAASATLESIHLPTPSKRHSRSVSAGTLNESDISMSDISEDDDEPRSPRKRGVAQKRKTGGNVFRDENGRVISREEAKRIRKRKTNRDSARRMRLLRKQQHDNLQQEVQDKSIDLQRANAMNRQISASYEQLQNQYTAMVRRDDTIVMATVELLEHISENIGSQLESSALANFLRQIVPFLPTNRYLPIKDELLAKSSKLIPKHIRVDATLSFEEEHVHEQASPSPSPEPRQLPPRPPQKPRQMIEHHPIGLHHPVDDIPPIPPFEDHLNQPDMLLMPGQTAMAPPDQNELPIIRMDGSTGSGAYADLLKLPSIDAYLGKTNSFEAMEIMDFLQTINEN